MAVSNTGIIVHPPVQDRSAGCRAKHCYLKRRFNGGIVVDIVIDRSRADRTNLDARHRTAKTLNATSGNIQVKRRTSFGQTLDTFGACAMKIAAGQVHRSRCAALGAHFKTVLPHRRSSRVVKGAIVYRKGQGTGCVDDVRNPESRKLKRGAGNGTRAREVSEFERIFFVQVAISGSRAIRYGQVAHVVAHDAVLFGAINIKVIHDNGSYSIHVNCGITGKDIIFIAQGIASAVNT